MTASAETSIGNSQFKGRNRHVSRGKFYLDKANAKGFGVCAGIADYTGFDVLWVRVGAVVLTLIGLSWLTIPAYIAVAVLADSRPAGLYSPEEEERLLRRLERRRNRACRGSLSPRSSRLRTDMSDLDRRIADMEAHYSSSSSRLAAEIDRLR